MQSENVLHEEFRIMNLNFPGVFKITGKRIISDF